MIAAPSWYAENLGERFAPAAGVACESVPRPLRSLVARSGLARGIALGLAARRGPGIAVIRRERGSLPALLVAGLPPARRRVFVLELIRRPPPRSPWRRLLYHGWTSLVERPALRRGMAAAQVMTEWERDEYAAHYRLDPARIHHIPWAWRDRGDPDPVPIREAAREVFASGRTATDWQTLFAAARGSGWRLVAVCSRQDERRVRALASGGAAEVEVEIPRADHGRLLRAADVCVITLADRELSAGQVRLMAAVGAGVPVVASSVRSLDGYTVAGETAVMVPAGDAGALRAEVDALLADPRRRRRLRDAAFERASRWTYDDYFARLRALIAGSLSVEPPPTASG